MTTFAIEILDLGFILTLGAWWAALTLVALAFTVIRQAVAGTSRTARGSAPAQLEA